MEYPTDNERLAYTEKLRALGLGGNVRAAIDSLRLLPKSQPTDNVIRQLHKDLRTVLWKSAERGNIEATAGLLEFTVEKQEREILISKLQGKKDNHLAMAALAR